MKSLKHLISPILAAAFVMTMVAIWHSSAPVVILMRGVVVKDINGVVTVDVAGYKLRGCNLVRGSSVGWYLSGGTWFETPFQYLDDLTPDSSRAAGFIRQSFGIWEWSRLPEDATSVRLTVQHECGDAVRTTQAGVFLR